MFCKKGTISIQKTVLCCPVFNPQMTGGTLPPGPVTEKVSVRHWVAVETLFPNPVFTTTPLSSNSIDVVVVLGPAITKLLKSNRTWKKLSGRKQMGAKSRFRGKVFSAKLLRISAHARLSWIGKTLFSMSGQKSMSQLQVSYFSVACQPTGYISEGESTVVTQSNESAKCIWLQPD